MECYVGSILQTLLEVGVGLGVGLGKTQAWRELLVQGSRNCDDFMNLEPELSCKKKMREGILILLEKNY